MVFLYFVFARLIGLKFTVRSDTTKYYQIRSDISYRNFHCLFTECFLMILPCKWSSNCFWAKRLNVKNFDDDPKNRKEIQNELGERPENNFLFERVLQPKDNFFSLAKEAIASHQWRKRWWKNILIKSNSWKSWASFMLVSTTKRFSSSVRSPYASELFLLFSSKWQCRWSFSFRFSFREKASRNST